MPHPSGRLPTEPGMFEIDLDSPPATDNGSTACDDTVEEPKDERTAISKLWEMFTSSFFFFCSDSNI